MSAVLFVKSISLAHINRIGLVNWGNRAWWNGRTVAIRSEEHRGWWRPEAKGYTDDPAQAWLTDFPTAYDHTKHCGPEKKISFCAVFFASPPSGGKMKELERLIVDYFEAAHCDVEQDGLEWFLSLYDEGPAISLTALAIALSAAQHSAKGE